LSKASAWRESAAPLRPLSLLVRFCCVFFCLGCADLGAGAPLLFPSLLAAGSPRTCAPSAVARPEERERARPLFALSPCWFVFAVFFFASDVLI
jgi:hypothetical protein